MLSKVNEEDLIEIAKITSGEYFRANNTKTLQQIYNTHWQVSELRSDNTYFIFNVGNRGNKQIEDLATYTIETNNGPVLNNWQNNYLTISRANVVLEKIDNAQFD
ncbi:MAG: hypothetical protein ABI861_04885, partial [Panacibacter sp.]